MTVKSDINGSEQRNREWPWSLLVEFAVIIFLFVFLLRTFVLEFYYVPSNSMSETLIEGDYVFVSKLFYTLGLPPTLPFINTRIQEPPRIWYKSIKRNDVIAFLDPTIGADSAPVTLVKRIVAIPGDTVFISRGEVVIRKLSINPTEKNKRRNVLWDIVLTDTNDVTRYVIPSSNATVRLIKNTDSGVIALINRDGANCRKHHDHILINGVEESEYTFRHDFFFLLGDNHDNSSDSREWGLLPDCNIVGKPLFIYWSRAPRNNSGKGEIRFFRMGKWIY